MFTGTNIAKYMTHVILAPNHIIITITSVLIFIVDELYNNNTSRQLTAGVSGFINTLQTERSIMYKYMFLAHSANDNSKREALSRYIQANQISEKSLTDTYRDFCSKKKGLFKLSTVYYDEYICFQKRIGNSGIPYITPYIQNIRNHQQRMHELTSDKIEKAYRPDTKMHITTSIRQSSPPPEYVRQ